MSDSTPGWQADPTGRFEHRYWDGTQWTDNVSNAGVASTDPFAPAAPTAATDAPAWGDPTVSQPAAPADPTASWPAPPVPPTSPPGPPAADSKRGLLIGGGILAAIVVAVVAFLLLGGDDDDLKGANANDTTDTSTTAPDTTDTSDDTGTIGTIDPSALPDDFEQQIADIYENTMGLSQDQAECLAGKIGDAVQSGDLDEEQAMSDVFGYLADCDIDLSDITGG
jgi:hypothetical protein